MNCSIINSKEIRDLFATMQDLEIKLDAESQAQLWELLKDENGSPLETLQIWYYSRVTEYNIEIEFKYCNKNIIALYGICNTNKISSEYNKNVNLIFNEWI